MKKVLLTTVFTGYNYGSSLQAFAGKKILSQIGLDCELVAMKSLVRGRDIRLGKLFAILWRSLVHARNSGEKSLTTYKSGYTKKMVGDSVVRFQQFTDVYLKPSYLSWNSLKNKAKECVACFAGSDQIWNSSTMYVDPLYYLRFAPAKKRMAFAPSFGRDFISDYNKAKMLKWISEFSNISIREDSGAKLIKELTGRDAIHLIDPTLMLDGNTWRESLDIKKNGAYYILAYFLDKPSELAREAIENLKNALKCEVIAIPYHFEDMSYCDRIESAGPVEFLNLIDNAICVLTDSFHGTAFSINLQTPFYIFGRSYGTAHSQNSRVESILKLVKMEERFEPQDPVKNLKNLDFEYSEQILFAERTKAIDYIHNCIS